MAVERFPVEEGRILLFARAIGDPNPVYADRDDVATTEGSAIRDETGGTLVADSAVTTTDQDGAAVLSGAAAARLDASGAR